MHIPTQAEPCQACQLLKAGQLAEIDAVLQIQGLQALHAADRVREAQQWAPAYRYRNQRMLLEQITDTAAMNERVLSFTWAACCQGTLCNMHSATSDAESKHGPALCNGDWQLAAQELWLNAVRAGRTPSASGGPAG